ncbi:NUDIX domain-containing protein [Candidatus Saccharibacteria bacterium]|nr:NUDIX domain-containing protein [Candidatus Saccharibacteria bacterium]
MTQFSPLQYSVRSRVAGIIIHNDSILLIRRKKNQKEFFVLPGGGIEAQESPKMAIKREILEETSINVTPGSLIYSIQYDNDASQDYFICRYVDGEPALGDYNEAAEMRQGGPNQYFPEWQPLAALPRLTLYPLEVRDWLIEDLKNNFTHTPRQAYIRVSDLRQN